MLSETMTAIREFDTPGPVLARIARYLTPGSEIEVSGYDQIKPRVEQAKCDGTPASIDAFATTYSEWLDEAKRGKKAALTISEDRRGELWEKWRGRALDFLRLGRSQAVFIVDYDDVLLAAQNQTPGRLFRASLADMGQIDWSQAALAALPNEEGVADAPYWLLFASLTALGFDVGDLGRLVGGRPAPGIAEADVAEHRKSIDDIVSRARTRPHGVLHAYRETTGTALPREIPELKPMLSIGKSVGKDYVTSLGWLVENQLFDEGRDEVD